MTKNIDLQQLTTQVCELARTVGTYLKEEINKLNSTEIESKGLHNFVTYIDKASEKRLMAELKKILPEAGFIAEESPGAKTSDRYNWVIDPLDGTTNYIHGLPVYSISIALTEKEKVISGVVYEPNLDECFYAWKGSKAFLNKKVIEVSKSTTINDSLFATGFPYHDYRKIEQYLDVFRFLMKNSHGLRRIGSAAIDLVYVACGRFEGFYEYGLSPWDVAAGSFIVKQAGGKASDFSGGENYIFGKEIVATNDKVYNEFMQLIKKYFA
ncbi:MAG: inositol monophosphatase [Bacteroidetes bacterium 4484_276]|nr:MAG: inositol monophosphatase [Bacteroidetes bacterium 4484_276]OYT12983.1 MAG: inositol monophosphatase [Bacteroidetes bacterium 4572_114]